MSAAPGSAIVAATVAAAGAATLCSRRPSSRPTRPASSSFPAPTSAAPPFVTGGKAVNEVALVDTELRKLVADSAFDFRFTGAPRCRVRSTSSHSVAGLCCCCWQTS